MEFARVQMGTKVGFQRSLRLAVLERQRFERMLPRGLQDAGGVGARIVRGVSPGGSSREHIATHLFENPGFSNTTMRTRYRLQRSQT